MAKGKNATIGPLHFPVTKLLITNEWAGTWFQEIHCAVTHVSIPCCPACAIEACHIRKYVFFFFQVQCQEPIIAICLVDLMDFFLVLPEVPRVAFLVYVLLTFVLCFFANLASKVTLIYY
ncbi:hypothetical protein ACJX0J_038957 [Zea mays]